MITLWVADDAGTVGTLGLVGDRVEADPPELRSLVDTRTARGMSLEQAFTDLDGWSNGWAWASASEPELQEAFNELKHKRGRGGKWTGMNLGKPVLKGRGGKSLKAPKPAQPEENPFGPEASGSEFPPHPPVEGPPRVDPSLLEPHKPHQGHKKHEHGKGKPSPATSEKPVGRDPFGPPNPFGPGAQGEPLPEGIRKPKVLKGDKGRPIRTGNVNEALKLLAAGKHVELKQPHQVSTLLGELQKRVKAAAAEGKEAAPINLCLLTVKGTSLFCAYEKGVPRIQMPQLKGVPKPGSEADKLPKDDRGRANIQDAFRKHLADKGIEISEESVLASHLKASQTELDGAKAARFLKQLMPGGKKASGSAGATPLSDPIFVTSDDYVLDGHHHWAAAVARDYSDDHPDLKIPVSRVYMSILDALAEANAFSEQMGIPHAGVPAPKPKVPKGAKPPEAPGKPSIATAADPVAETIQRAQDWGRRFEELAKSEELKAKGKGHVAAVQAFVAAVQSEKFEEDQPLIHQNLTEPGEAVETVTRFMDLTEKLQEVTRFAVEHHSSLFGLMHTAMALVGADMASELPEGAAELWAELEASKPGKGASKEELVAHMGKLLDLLDLLFGADSSA